MVEFLWETHCVLPPSVHGSGNRYKFINCKFPQNSPTRINSDTIYDFMNEFLNFTEVINGVSYGGVSLKIQPEGEFIAEAKLENLTKYLLHDIYCIIDIETAGLPERKEGKQVFRKYYRLHGY